MTYSLHRATIVEMLLNSLEAERYVRGALLGSVVDELADSVSFAPAMTMAREMFDMLVRKELDEGEFRARLADLASLRRRAGESRSRRATPRACIGPAARRIQRRGLMLGACPERNGTTFRTFTTTAAEVAVRFFDAEGKTPTRTAPLDPCGDGIFEATFADVGEGALYVFVLDRDEVPDPYARFLPLGVHGPARVVAEGREAALAVPPESWVIYELHVGTFTQEGTYRAATERLDDLVSLGVTTIELLPVHAFPGQRGWGYDGVALFAPFAPYGTPEDLRAFVRAAHARGLAVILDVVYNHFGPSGNYLARYSPSYFAADVDTPWGQGPDFTMRHMRAIVTDNVRMWLEEYGFDGLRLDASHAIHDPSPKHILREVVEIAHACMPPRRVFFEDERNDPSVIREHGADGVWADDLHHQIHVLLTGERDGYYAAYEPTLEALARCIREGWTYTGQPFVTWKGRPRGKPLGDLSHTHLVTCIQNHDQIGNRALGTRLTDHVDPDAFVAAAVLALFLPHTPLLFMGQEWGATAPFLFFSDHGGELGKNVSKGRREEFKGFASFAGAEIPDPEALDTFARSKLDWDERNEEPHARILSAHRALLELRRNDPVLRGAGEIETAVEGDVLVVTRKNDAGVRRLIVRFGSALPALPAGFATLFSSPRAAVLRALP